MALACFKLISKLIINCMKMGTNLLFLVLNVRFCFALSWAKVENKKKTRFSYE